MRTRGGRVYDRSEVYKISMVRMFRRKLTKLGMYGSRRRIFRNELDTYKCSKCGLVNFAVMKIHLMLQALTNLQAHTNDLRIYVKIVITEQGKLRTWRFYYPRSVDKKKSNL